MKIGVLALQGAFVEHLQALRRLGVATVEVRLPRDLKGLDGLILPGGESTTIGKLAVEYDLMDPLQEFGQVRPIWGTCAGAIFLSRDVHRHQPLLGLMDIEVQRNAFGRQLESFEADLEIPVLARNGNGHARTYHGIFIRAPLIETVGPGVEVLARLDRPAAPAIVAARQGRLLATSFHPELTRDDRFHQFFLDVVAGR